jgi:hypothetical protein
MSGLGTANWTRAGGRGQLNITPDERGQFMHDLLGRMGYEQLQGFQSGQENMLGRDFLRSQTDMANYADSQNMLGLLGAGNNWQGYQGPDLMQGLNSGMIGNFNPNQAASNYTNLLRQQAQPQEQQAAASALTGLFGSGRLGTTGGMNAYQGLIDSQNQADIGRQVAGQQFGLQQQLMAQQGYDQARMNQQGLMMNNFGAGQQGLLNAFNVNQGLFNRSLDMYNAGSDTTQSRFERAMQLFGGENAMNQQFLGNFQGLLGADQSNQQQLMDMARIGASVGNAQTAAGANAAQIRNQGNQDMIAGFLGALGNWSRNRNPGTGGGK